MRARRARHSDRRSGAARAVLAALLAALCLLPGMPQAAAQSVDAKPQLRIAPRILVEVDIETPLMISVAPSEALPTNSYLQLRGLPEAASLNEGHAISPGVWAVPLRSLGNLTIQAPQAAAGTTDFVVRVLSIEGRVLTETRSSVIVAPAFQLTPRASLAESTARSTQPPPQAPPAAVVAPPARERVAEPAPRIAAVTPPPPAAPARPAPPPPQAAPQPQAAPAPPPAAGSKRPVLSTEDRARLERMVTLGNRHLGSGNIAAAREFFRRAAEGGLGEGALLLASTYDPAELQAIQVQGLSPDPAEARKWYELARSLGASGADARLARLGAR